MNTASQRLRCQPYGTCFPLRWQTVLCSFILVAAIGCRTSDRGFSRIINEPAPLPEQVRAGFGVVGVLPTRAAPELGIQYPASQAEAMVPIAGTTFGAVWKSSQPDMDEERFNSKTGRYESRTRDLGKYYQEEAGNLAFSLLVAGVAGVVGGILAGVPEADIKQGEVLLRAALMEKPLEPAINNHLQQIATRRHVPNLIPIPRAAAEKLNASSVTNRDFKALAGTGINSVLIIHVFEQRFEDLQGLNPPMTFAAGVDLQVVRVSDGALLHSGHLDYRGRSLKFTEWAENDARRFRAELERASRTVASIAIEQLFTPTARK